MKNTNKKSLIFLPGWGFKATIWNSIAALFTDCEVKQLDLPEAKDFETAVSKLAEQIPANSTIVGWSLGGLIATALCQNYPEKCSNLVLVSSLPKFISASDWVSTPTENADYFQQLANTDLAELLKQFTMQVQYPNHSTAIHSTLSQNSLSSSTDAKTLLFYVDVILNKDVRESFKELSMRSHCLFGAQDALVPVLASVQLNLLNRNTTIKVIDDAGHIPFLTHPEIFTSWLTGIINE